MKKIGVEIESLISKNVHTVIIHTEDSDAVSDYLKDVITNMNMSILLWDDCKITGCDEIEEVGGDDILPTIGTLMKSSLYPEMSIRRYSTSKCFKNSVLLMKDVEIVNGEGMIDGDILNAIKEVDCETDCMSSKTIIILTNIDPPKEFLDHAVVLNVPQYLDRKDILKVMDEVANSYNLEKGVTYVPSDSIVNTARGLSTTEIKSALKNAIMLNSKLTEEENNFLIDVKRRKIQAVCGLIYHDSTCVEIGGLNAIKQWLNDRKHLYCQEARDYGLSAPRGIFLLGPPGSGKSLSAKMVANTLDMPLLEFDTAQLFCRYVGDGEKIAKKMFDYLDNCGPCVLWIDEVEKILPAASGNAHETTLRLTGMLLTWLQERGPNSEVFVVCTSNNPANVPIELLRKGRFDQLFYLDLPSEDERYEILRIHLNRINKSLPDSALRSIATLSDGYSGAEIAAAVNAANLNSFLRDKIFLESDLRNAILADIPLSKRDFAFINAYREIAMQYGISATTGACNAKTSQVLKNSNDEEVDYLYQ